MRKKSTTMMNLTPDQIHFHLDAIDSYVDATNAATGAKVDSNANIEKKTIASLKGESHKSEDIQINRAMVQEQLVKSFGPDQGRRLAKQYIRDLEDHIIYANDETSLATSYCAAISLFPMLELGTRVLGGKSSAPKHLSSYVGQLLNTIFMVSSQVAGAVGIPGALVHFDAYARNDYGDDYLETNEIEIKACLENFLYTVNEPAGSRNGQSAFTNISIFDKAYFEALYGAMYYPAIPDIKPNWESYNKLQEYAVDLIREENTKQVLTFPVKTATVLHDGTNPKDPDFVDMIADDLSKGSLMFIYLSQSVDSLSSCCFSGMTGVDLKADGQLYSGSFRTAYEDLRKFSTLQVQTLVNGSVEYRNCDVVRVSSEGKKMYRIVFSTKENPWGVSKVYATDDHLHPVVREKSGGGYSIEDVRTDQLVKGDRVKSALYSSSFVEVAEINLKPMAPVEDYVYCLEMEDQTNPYFILPNGVLTHNCRLKNSLIDDEDEVKEFSHSLGAGGVSTGSLNVITLNISRIVQEGKNLKSIVDRVHKYQVAHRHIFERFRDNGMYPFYDAGFVDMDKQFLTIGVNGIVEAAESQGIVIEPGGEYQKFVNKILSTISESNKEAKATYGYKVNTEQVPAESLAKKNADWDREDGLRVPRDSYNSYMFPVEDPKLSIVDKFKLHGAEFVKNFDGGQALHLNLDEHPTKEGYIALINLAIKTGCEYFTTNVIRTCCEDCGYVEFSKQSECVECGSGNISHATRIIGYLKKIPSFSEPRQEEANLRTYLSFDEEQL